MISGWGDHEKDTNNKISLFCVRVTLGQVKVMPKPTHGERVANTQYREDNTRIAFDPLGIISRNVTKYRAKDDRTDREVNIHIHVGILYCCIKFKSLESEVFHSNAKMCKSLRLTDFYL